MRRIVIVGTGSGIGRELAGLFSKDGSVELIVLSRSEPAEDNISYTPFDVLTDNDPPLVEGALDGLVYCPGSITLKSFEGLSMKDFRTDMEINFFGAVRVLRHFQRALKKSGSASVVLFSSVAARVGMPFHSSISSAKSAVEGLVRSLAAEWAPAVRVNAIAPSLVDTRLAERLVNSESKLKMAADRHPMKRIGTAAEMAELASFLLSDKSSWITGQVLGADGGMSTIKN